MVVRVFFNGEHDHNIKAIINDHRFDLGRWDSKALHARSLVALPPSERLAKQCCYKSAHSYFKGISHTPLFAITLPFSMPISPHQNACIHFNVYKHFKFYVDAFRPSMFRNTGWWNCTCLNSRHYSNHHLYNNVTLTRLLENPCCCYYDRKHA